MRDQQRGQNRLSDWLRGHAMNTGPLFGFTLGEGQNVQDVGLTKGNLALEQLPL
jgi:hypothetical protein